MPTLPVSDLTFAHAVLSRPGPLVVCFHGTWCGPSRRLMPILEKLSADRTLGLPIATVDVDRQPELAARYGVLSLPLLMVFSSGAPVASMAGFQPAPGVRAFLGAHAPLAAVAP